MAPEEGYDHEVTTTTEDARRTGSPAVQHPAQTVLEQVGVEVDPQPPISAWRGGGRSRAGSRGWAPGSPPTSAPRPPGPRPADPPCVRPPAARPGRTPHQPVLWPPGIDSRARPPAALREASWSSCLRGAWSPIIRHLARMPRPPPWTRRSGRAVVPGLPMIRWGSGRVTPHIPSTGCQPGPTPPSSGPTPVGPLTLSRRTPGSGGGKLEGMDAPGTFRPPRPANEPTRSYAPGSAERASLQARLAEM